MKPSDKKDFEAPPEKLLTAVLNADHFHVEGPIARWYVEKAHIERLKNHPAETWLPLFEKRVPTLGDGDQLDTLFHLSGCVLGGSGGAFLRKHWNLWSPETFKGLTFAAIHCLPSEEAYDLVTDQLGRMHSRERTICKFVLGWFESRLVLDWIEDNIESPVDASWGALAARSCFDWGHLVKWLEAGRPVSLAALDALGFCLTRPTAPDGHRYKPLVDPPTELVFRNVLENYLETDPVPRVERTVGLLLSASNNTKE